MPNGENTSSAELQALVARVTSSVLGMNGFLEDAKEQIRAMNSAIDELDQKVGLLRDRQRQANQLIGAMESGIKGHETVVKGADPRP